MGTQTLPTYAEPGVGGLLPGMIMAYAGATTQPGWLLCNGALLNRADYPQLFIAIGTTYNTGGEAPTEFRLPNLKGKTIVMQDISQVEFDVLGETGGSKTSTAPHTHSLSAHTHTLSTGSPSNNTSDGPSNNNSGTPSDNSSDWPSPNGTGGGSGTTNYQSDNFGNYQHYHTAQFVRVVYSTDNVTHAHGGGANTLSEGKTGGNYYGANATIDVATTDTNHWHGTSPHTHDLQNHRHDLKQHYHGLSSHTHTMAAHLHSGTSAAPNSDISGAASAGVASGNLQPYIALNYLIKT